MDPAEAVVLFTEGWLADLATDTPQDRARNASPLGTKDVRLYVYWEPGFERQLGAPAWFGSGDVGAVRFSVMRRGAGGQWYVRRPASLDLDTAAREFVGAVGKEKALDMIRRPAVRTNPVDPRWINNPWRF